MTKSPCPEERALITTAVALVAAPHNHSGFHGDLVMRLDQLIKQIDQLAQGGQNSEARKVYAQIHDGDFQIILHRAGDVVSAFCDRPFSVYGRHSAIDDLAREVTRYFDDRSRAALSAVGIVCDAE